MNYILDGHETKPVEDIIEWATSFQNSNRIVEQTTIGEVMVSTVFLGIDHGMFQGNPLLFETMVFGGDEDGWQERYTTWDEAVEGHKNILKMIVP